MAKLMEMSGAEMCAALVEIAAPIRRFMDDPEFDEAFKKATQKGVATRATDILQIYTDIVPQLFGKKHLKDTLAILAVIEGKTVKQMLEMNGADLMADAVNAFNEQLAPFFTRLGISVGGKQ
ncbi:MAG: hypothetical protein J6S82_03650 [Bacteroidales bacterium]|nr:hypothetical protein [Bacteroidales bacterium]